MTFGLALFSALLLLTGISYFGWRKPAYSHWHDTISEVGEVGSPLARAVSYGLFLPVGLLLGLVAALADTTALAGLAGCIGTGYVVAAFFPCDVGSPVSGSGRQQIHNIGGAVEYIGSAYWLTQLSPQRMVMGYNLYSIAAGSLIVGSILLSIPGLGIRGLIQRIMEGILFGSLLLAS
ncbi:DUF998 domain-containing protein [Spirosoma flavum]|uniref:DUF998 domain-containing protein n=1 Tax=Spirosoma flavum TaxID=2048557 RepID=A0ABW6ASJ4_9BACT